MSSQVTTETAKLFSILVKNTEICKYLFKNEIYWSISKICIDNEMPWILLPPIVKKLIIKSLVVSLSVTVSIDSFIESIIRPLIQRFDSLFTKSRETLHSEIVIKEVMSLIETFNGVIEGILGKKIKNIINNMLIKLKEPHAVWLNNYFLLYYLVYKSQLNYWVKCFLFLKLEFNSISFQTFIIITEKLLN